MPKLLVLIITLAGPLAAADLIGQVMENLSGNPVASAEVQVSKVGEQLRIAELTTELDGRFGLSGLLGGEYVLVISKTNYAPTTLRLKMTNGPKNVVARLIRLAAIAGQVLDPAGQPVRDAVVTVMMKPPGTRSLNRPTFENGAFAKTDEQGRYRLYNLAPGQYALALIYGASTFAMGSTGDRETPATLGSGVVLYPSNAETRLFTITGGEDIQSIDFTLTPGALASVSGTVEKTGSAGDFWLALTDVNRPLVATAVTQSKADGTFRFDGVPPGSYDLFASGPSHGRSGMGGILEANAAFGRTRVEVSGQNVEDLHLDVRKGLSIGFLLQAQPGCPARAELSVSAQEDRAVYLGGKTAINSSGPQRISGLAPGRYDVSLTGLGETCYCPLKTINLRENDATAPLLVPVANAAPREKRE